MFMETRDHSSIEDQSLNPEAAAAAESAQTVTEPACTEDSNPEALAENEITEAVEQEQASEIQEQMPEQELTKAAVIAAAEEMLAQDGSQVAREAVGALRHRFETIRKREIENARTLWAEAGNSPADFVETPDPDEDKFAEILAALKAKREQWLADQIKERLDNLESKNAIIDKIIALADDTDNVNRTFPEYRELQERFNSIGRVPDTDETDVWKRFQDARERYSDNLKINKELRDYDFKKNLEGKLRLVDEALALASETDIIAAFRSLQQLHEKWREIGPVAKELREELWQKFQEASTVIRKQYQAHFEERKAREAANEAAKNAMCDELEAIDITAVASFNAWDELTAKVLEIQARWKETGPASHKVNNALFARFRGLCDQFFSAKAEYYKKVKEGYAANLTAKTALVEKAEALQDSTDWRTATEQFQEMQKQWRTIGAVPKKHSDAIWKRFIAACDHFFDAKKKATSGRRSQEQDNLKAKLDIIAAIEAITTDTDKDADALRALQEKWQATGHVPFRDKDKVNEAYRQAVGTVRRRFNAKDRKAGIERFESNISAMEGDSSKLMRERERLLRAREARRNEIRTYENNIGFLTSKSATGRSLVSDFMHKIERLKSDIQQIEEKISLIDEKLK